MVLRIHRTPSRHQAPPGHAHGPLNRVADNSLAKKLLGWEPKVLFREGLKRTIDWYYATREKRS